MFSQTCVSHSVQRRGMHGLEGMRGWEPCMAGGEGVYE